MKTSLKKPHGSKYEKNPYKNFHGHEYDHIIIKMISVTVANMKGSL